MNSSNMSISNMPTFGMISRKPIPKMTAFSTPLTLHRPSGLRPRLCLAARPPNFAARRRTARMLLADVGDKSLRVLVVGGGGREHALSVTLARSRYVREVLVAPGNAGTIGESIRRLPDIDAEDVNAVVAAAISSKADLVVVGPEVALVAGVIDELRAAGVRAFGPGRAGAALEGSKGYAKSFMARHEIPSARYERFENVGEACAYVKGEGVPIVVKADGLAAGKGVVVAMEEEEAIRAVDEMITGGRFGDAGKAIVIEEYLTGEEVSFFAVCDGERAVALASAQDHKKAFDGDEGPNTGGMGAYSPAPVCGKEMIEGVMRDVVEKTVMGMRKDGVEFRGVLFVGLMIDEEGKYRVLEYNVRFGDPECQVLCARMKSDLCELLYRAAEGDLEGFEVEWSEQKAVVVVMASEGYPGSYGTGSKIGGIERAEEVESVKVYHAGTKEKDGMLVSDGGRVLGVTAMGDSIVEARERAYEGVRRIEWEDAMWRSDIGWRAVEREGASMQMKAA